MTGRTQGIISAGAAVFVSVSVFVVERPKAWAQCSEDHRRTIYKLNRDAMDLYQAMEFTKTKKKLSRAFIFAKKNDCAFDWIHALTLTNLGILSAGAYHKQKLARRFLMEALRVRPEASIDPRFANPLITRIFRQARRKLRITEKPQPWPELIKPKPKGPKPPDFSLAHESIDEAPRGKPLVISCRTSDEIHPEKVVVFYRPGGRSDTYERVIMEKVSKDPYGWKGTIPARAMRANTLQYYIQALGEDDKVLASSGNAMSPNIVSVTGKGGGGEDPFGSGRGGKPKPKGHRKAVGLWLQIGPTWGIGLARGHVEVLDEEGGIAVQTGKPYDQIENPGFALGSIGGEVEFGYFVRPKLLISLYGRFGYIGLFTKNVEGAAMADGWGMFRVRYFFASVAGGWLDFYGGGGIGFGLIRHVVDEDLSMGTFKDTDLSMGIMPGAVLGMTIGKRDRTVSGYFETNLLTTFWKSMDLFTFHVDLSMGINFYF